MEEKQNIRLWKNTFDTKHWKNSIKIDLLLSQMKTMDGIIEKYLTNIQVDFPQLTDHSITHSNTLWKYADIIIGDKKNYLNPLEGFILNSVFLVHDSGMCATILSNEKEIKESSDYLDYIFLNSGKLEKEELEKEALFYAVRQNHGDYAFRISTQQLKNQEYLIGDLNFREEFGEFIGKIAKSHTCNINYIEREFGKSYSSPHFPGDWTIDFQKLSFILRTADAAHIDNLRTPKTLQMINEITGESKEHWSFQKKLGFPILDDDGFLFYVTNKPFGIDEQKAWWYCFNALKTLDEELKDANDYFVTNHKEGFTAIGVKYVNDTLALGRLSIKTTGWDSLNTAVRVSNPIHIASELGGEKLYGNKNIALRELIQNSIDAIQVHRIHTGQNNLAVGRIKIKVEEFNNDFYLSISDNGIGMSQSLMTNELLDFGGSYWKSNKFQNDFKGLSSKGFESIGKFGIGFFSVFMLGKEVTVTSWKYGENIDSMRTLEFYDGLFSNPILRQPTDVEKNNVIDKGTLIKIKLDNHPNEKDGLIRREGFRNCTLLSLVKFYIPSPNVEIVVEELDGSMNIIPPNHIEGLNFPQLIEHTNLKGGPVDPKVEFDNSIGNSINIYKNLPLDLIEILDDKDHKIIRGKLALLPRLPGTSSLNAVVLAKGIRVKELDGMIGYINTNEVISIKRDMGAKVVSFESMKTWAIETIKKIQENNLVEIYNHNNTLEGLKLTFGLHDDLFPLLITKKSGSYTVHTILKFRQDLKKTSKISFYMEGHNRLTYYPDCPGYIHINLGLPMNDIIVDEDLIKTKNYMQLIKQIIKEEWGDFEESNENLMMRNFDLNAPYMSIQTFTKK